ncbi:MAG: rhomboid family intramembrane serine protease [Gilvibacter sp.]
MLIATLGLVLFIWIAYWADLRFGLRMRNLGIFPRTAEGLLGVIFTPLVHKDLGHISNNSISLLALLYMLFYFYERISWKVLFWGVLLSGLATWAIGRPAYHIGASGVVYVLVSFLFFKGIFSKFYRLIALSMVVVFLYGGLLWYVFPIDPKISWEGHLSGFFVGFVLAAVIKSRVVRDTKYVWEDENYIEDDDPFLQHFDEDGNFIEKLPEEELPEVDPQESQPKPKVVIKYSFKKSNESKDSK